MVNGARLFLALPKLSVRDFYLQMVFILPAKDRKKFIETSTRLRSGTARVRHCMARTIANR